MVCIRTQLVIKKSLKLLKKNYSKNMAEVKVLIEGYTSDGLKRKRPKMSKAKLCSFFVIHMLFFVAFFIIW